MVSFGQNFSLIVCSNGMLFSFGTSNSEGQLGHGDLKPRNSPELVIIIIRYKHLKIQEKK